MTFKSRQRKHDHPQEVASSDPADSSRPEMSLAFPVVGGLFVYLLLTGFLLVQPHGDIHWITWFTVVTKAVQGFMVVHGWTALGLASALLAAALTAVSIVGYRSTLKQLPVKLESIRNTIEALIYSATALAALIAVGYFSGVTSLLLFSDAVDALELSTQTPASESPQPLVPGSVETIVPHLEHTFTSLLLGFCALLVVVCARFLMRTVSIWFATDSEVHASEQALLLARVDSSQTRIRKLTDIVGSTSQSSTTLRAYLLTGPACVLAASATGGIIGSFTGTDNMGVFAGLAGGLNLYLVFFGLTVAVPLLSTYQRGALVRRIKGAPAAANGRWRLEIAAWSMGLCFTLIPALVYAWYFLVNASVGPLWAILLVAIVVAPLGLSFFVVPAGASWLGIAAHSARKELTGSLAADEQRLAVLSVLQAEPTTTNDRCIFSRFCRGNH